MNLGLFKKVVVSGLKYFAYFFLVFLVGRLSFLLTYGNFDELSQYKSGLLKAFWIGARFDVSAICYGFLPLVLFWLISLFMPKSKESAFIRFYNLFSRYFLLLILFLFVSLIIVDYFFYQFFQSHINPLFFGIFHDDTTAVLNSVWTDYPLFKITLVYVFALILFLFLSKKVEKRVILPVKRNNKIFSLILLLIFPLFFVGMRGSLGVFTLRREHTNVTTNEFVNSLCYNALYSLKFANSEQKENEIKPDITQELASNGFKTKEEVQAIYQNDLGSIFDQNLKVKTPYNEFLENNPPNVVFLQMESMSNHYFELNNNELNLLGDLTEELPYLYYFKNGLSAYNGTIQTLENFLVGTPKTIISQSVYFDTPFSSSIALPFKSIGYTTSFMTGASISWRNIDNFIKHQGFDKIGGGNLIKEKFPDAEEFAWGVHDGYLFDYIEYLLNQNPNQPQFIFGLTISNHTPFEIPNHYKLYPIKMSNEIKHKIRVDEATAYANFASHQYAASQLARFIKDIRNSPLGENTIIVASGDHNIRQVFEYTPEEGFLKRSVPILMYIPKKYQPEYFDDQIVVSHKDIFPSIFNLSLSNAQYTYTGDDMFNANQPYRFAINDYNFMADSVGVLSIENNKPYYYTWTGNHKRQLTVNDNQAKHARYMLQKMKAYTTIQTIGIYSDIQKNLERKRKP